jgi:hypothetical protein
LLGLAAGCATAPPTQPSAVVAEAPPPARARSPFIEPPGAYSAAVRQENIGQTICVSGWTATVRPSTIYTNGVKRQMLREAGVDVSEVASYELDHFVPLALGGHPRSLDNLWLQRWDGEWNAGIKDRLERKLHTMVCNGQITLDVAQSAIQHDWRAAYRTYVRSDRSIGPRGREFEK